MPQPVFSNARGSPAPTHPEASVVFSAPLPPASPRQSRLLRASSVPSPEQEKEQTKLEAAVTVAEKRVAAAQKKLPKLQGAWEPDFREHLKKLAEAWQPVAPTEVKSEGGAMFTKQEDGSWLA